jgi:hypothetical protein
MNEPLESGAPLENILSSRLQCKFLQAQRPIFQWFPSVERTGTSDNYLFNQFTGISSVFAFF